jgi:hypothetical protein
MVPVTPIEPPGEDLGAGVIAGIVIVAVAVLICAGAGVFYFLSVRKRRAAAASSSPNGMEMRPASTRSNGMSSMQTNGASSNGGYGGAPYEVQPQAHVIPTKAERRRHQGGAARQVQGAHDAAADTGDGGHHAQLAATERQLQQRRHRRPQLRLGAGQLGRFDVPFFAVVGPASAEPTHTVA